MAVGDVADITARLQRWLPARWFPTGANYQKTRIYGTLAGFATALSKVYSELAYVKLQTRIKTATDGFLDLISWDFFGPTLPRRTNETDASFRARILPNLLRPRVTRAGMIITLKSITGRTPKLFEPIRPPDTGTMDSAYFGFDIAGGLSDYSLFPYEMMIVAYLGNGASANEIYAAVEATRPIATVAYVAILPNRLHFGDAINSNFLPCIGVR